MKKKRSQLPAANLSSLAPLNPDKAAQARVVTKMVENIRQAARRCLPKLKAVVASGHELGIELPAVESLIELFNYLLHSS